jgi:phosphatidylinositol alpha-1,6-mannosyltransferase
MRVLFLTDSLSDLDGVGRYAVRLIAALEKLRPDIEVDILLARKHRPTSAEVPARWNVRVALPPDYFYYMPPWRFWPSAWLASARIASAARRCDIVHAIKDYPHNYAALVGARRAQRPCIATAHGTYSVLPLQSPRHSARARWAYRRFAAMIAVSRYTRRRLLEILSRDELDPEHVRVIPNAVSAEHYASPRSIGARPWHATPFTLAIGEVKERKGHHLSLAAWAHVAGEHAALHHYIVGKSTGDAYHASLLDLARRAGMSERVHFLGNVSEDEKVDLLQRAQVFVHTPVTAADGGFEGFGIVYLEASACGTPAIGTRDSGAEDAIEDGVTGFLVDQDVPAVERALRRLLADGALRAQLGAAGRERARRSSWEQNARAVLALYDEVLALEARS